MTPFAYGSNMDRLAMKRRCPGARAVGPAVLESYRFFVGVDGWGSVSTSRGASVHGVLWRLTPRDVAALHAYELLHQGLYDVRYLPVRHGSRHVRAMIYLLRRRATGAARPGYVEYRHGGTRLEFARSLCSFSRALVQLTLHWRTNARSGNRA